MRRERDRRVQSGRADPFAVFVLSLSPKVWLDANGLTPGLLDTWPNKGSVGAATAAGALRPTATGGTEVTFAGGQQMDTPSFSMGARSSGSVAMRFDSDYCGPFSFGAVNEHTTIFSFAGTLYQRTTAATDCTTPQPSAPPYEIVISWSFDTSGGTVIFGGATVARPAAASLVGVTSIVRVGDAQCTGALLAGAIHELVLVDAAISGADLTALHNGLRAKWGI